MISFRRRLLTAKQTLWRKAYKYSRSKYRLYCNGMFRQESRARIENGIKVSRHAIDRYLERVEGYDFDEIASKLTEGLAERVAEEGDGKYIVGDARVTVLKDTIVTVDTTKHNLPFSKRVIANPIRGIERFKGEKL